MAKGNWSQSGLKAKARCRLCGRAVSKKDMVRLNGVNPAHKLCADGAGRSYTLELMHISQRATQESKQGGAA